MNIKNYKKKKVLSGNILEWKRGFVFTLFAGGEKH
jgi:hypothetical protein